MEQLKPIKRGESTTEKVFVTLRNSILSINPFKPGQYLSENVLANQLQISRTPVREAFKRLEQAGLVRTAPQKGTQVLRFSPKKLKEAAQLRCVLEIWGAKRAINCLVEDDIKQMYSLQQSIREAFFAKDFLKHLQYDTRFHYIFLRAAGNSRIIEVIDQENFHLNRLRVLWLMTGRFVDDQAFKPHDDLIKAFEKKDFSLVENLINKHLDFDSIIDEMEEVWPEYFEGA